MEKYFVSFNYKNISKKNKKVPYITKKTQYNYLIEYNYTIKELKCIINHFKIKCTKQKKDEIRNLLTNILYLSNFVNKIQKLWKKYLICLFNKTLGPSYKNYQLSNNVDDFLTTENIKDINYYYYFSFKDKDNFIYTFNLVSIYSLINKNINKNPYNRCDFSKELIDKIKLRMRYNKILNETKEFQIYQPRELSLKEKIHSLFHKMDELGNYTNVNWFLELNNARIYKFLYELYEIWNFRAQLTNEHKRNICPPHGNPFIQCNKLFLTNLMNQTNIQHYSFTTLRNIAYRIMYKFIYSSQNNDNQNMGVIYILSSLTLVSENARASLPWLYASVYYN